MVLRFSLCNLRDKCRESKTSSSFITVDFLTHTIDNKLIVSYDWLNSYVYYCTYSVCVCVCVCVCCV